MITSIKNKTFKAKFPYFIQKQYLVNDYDHGKGRIILCLSEQKSVLIQNGKDDNFKIGEEISFNPNLYSIIDEITFATEYDYK